MNPGMNRVISFSSNVARGLAALAVLAGCDNDEQYVSLLFERTDLVADRSGLSEFDDPNLVNPIGLQLSPSTSFWTANNATGTATFYQRDGLPLPPDAPLAVQMPVPAGAAADARAHVTGIAYNRGSGFSLTSEGRTDSARYLFVTEEGTILGYNAEIERERALIAVDNSASGAVYRGATIVNFRSGPRLYVTNFSHGSVDVFDTTFAPASGLDGAAFEDQELPAGYAPFGIQRIDDVIYVSYAERDADGRNVVVGAGKGRINAFDLDGEFLVRVSAGAELDAPWGMTRLPWGFPYFGSALLVGNHGDGRINAFDPWGGGSLGPLYATVDEPVAIDGLWDLGLSVGPDGSGAIYFSAGPNGGENGVFGRLQAVLVDAPTPE
jgi:uncharacterized protein (TIGR03118 family)